MKKTVIAFLCSLLLFAAACTDDGDRRPDHGTDDPDSQIYDRVPGRQNLLRAMQIVDAAIPNYFEGSGMLMSRFYNPYTGVREEIGGSGASIWKYTSAIEAVNAVMRGLQTFKEHGEPELYDEHFGRYSELLYRLYDNAAFYKGTYTLTSYTRTKAWSVYAVPRGDGKGQANPGGDNHKFNVYDDQMWLIRELLEAYRLTGNREYLDEAEYLTDYVLDGWDCTLDDNGVENGGIPWGPGYVTKHSCSNGPMVSPLVWLHEMYKGKDDEVTYGYIAADNSRRPRTVKKSEYYLDFAIKVYDYQKSRLLRSDGVYDDMMGGCGSKCDPQYETVDGVKYRANSPLRDRVGPAYTYNSGTMLSGAADLYRATGESVYSTDLQKLMSASFNYFAKKDASVPGYYTYPIEGYSNWFNGVLFRGYVDAYAINRNAAACIATFQDNLDYGYDNFFYKGFLPTNLLVGWSRVNTNNRVEGMFTFAFAAEYAILASYELGKEN